MQWEECDTPQAHVDLLFVGKRPSGQVRPSPSLCSSSCVILCMLCPRLSLSSPLFGSVGKVLIGKVVSQITNVLQQSPRLALPFLRALVTSISRFRTLPQKEALLKLLSICVARFSNPSTLLPLPLPASSATASSSSSPSPFTGAEGVAHSPDSQPQHKFSFMEMSQLLFELLHDLFSTDLLFPFLPNSALSSAHYTDGDTPSFQQDTDGMDYDTTSTSELSLPSMVLVSTATQIVEALYFVPSLHYVILREAILQSGTVRFLFSFLLGLIASAPSSLPDFSLVERSAEQAEASPSCSFSALPSPPQVILLPAPSSSRFSHFSSDASASFLGLLNSSAVPCTVQS